MNDAHRETYKEEARELLVELENALLELAETPDDKDIIGKVFRAMHTIKGSGAMFGFDNVARFTHEIETVYDKVRSGDIPVTKTLISLTLRARDIILAMLDDPAYEAPTETAPQEIIGAFRELLLASDGESPPLPTASLSSTEASHLLPRETPAGEISTYRIRFIPSPDIFITGTNPFLLLDELHSLGECSIIAQRDSIPDLDTIDPERCYISWDIVVSTNKGLNAVKDVFIFVEDLCEIKIDVIEPGVVVEGGGDLKKLGEILVERGDVTEQQLQSGLSEKRLLGEILIDKGVVAPDRIESALAEQLHMKTMREKTRTKEEGISSIRVPAEKLDILVNLVGELVTVQARLSQIASNLSGNELTSVAEEVERLTAELRDNTLNVRMLPIGTTFGRFKRLIHDLSEELGKEIDMTTEGAETELDKTVIERLNDPLVHLIRNCIDHAIEPPEARLSAGKSRKGGGRG